MPSPTLHVEDSKRSPFYSLRVTEVFLFVTLFFEKVNDSVFEFTFGKIINEFKYAYHYKEDKTNRRSCEADENYTVNKFHYPINSTFTR